MPASLKGGANLEFTITVNKASSSVITVDYELSDGTAVAGVDYDGTPGSVDIPVGETSFPILVPLNGDTDIEADETFTLTLTAASGATLGTVTATGTITNDDHADPSAYYTGTATIKDPDDPINDIVVSDLNIMVSGNRLMMMTVNDILLYDAQITSISGNAFTADATIYMGMDLNSPPLPVTTTLSGTITEGTRIEGTIAGTGAATGVFTADYVMSQTTADSADIAKTWDGYFNNQVNMNLKFTLDASGVVTVNFGDYPGYGVFADCVPSGSILPVSTESIFSVSLDMSNCATHAYRGNYTGLAIPKSVTNDTLAIAFSNGLVSGFGEFAVVP